MCKDPHVWETSHVRCLISSSHKIKDVKIRPDLSLHKDLKAGQSWDFRSCATLCQALIFGTTPFSGPFSAPYSVLILHKTENFHFTNKISRSRSDNCPFPKSARVFLGFWFRATSERKKKGVAGSSAEGFQRNKGLRERESERFEEHKLELRCRFEEEIRVCCRRKRKWSLEDFNGGRTGANCCCWYGMGEANRCVECGVVAMANNRRAARGL